MNLTHRRYRPVRPPAMGGSWAPRRDKALVYLVAFTVTWVVQALAVEKTRIVSPAEQPASSLVQVGFSRGILPAVNEKDAVAAVKVWFDAISREKQLGLRGAPQIYESKQTLRQGLVAGKIDIVALSTREYLAIPQDQSLNPLYAGVVAGTISEQYLLLVRKDSGLTAVSNLRHRQVIVHAGYRSSLTRTWLEVLLADLGCPPIAKFFDYCETREKLSHTILPVYFGKVEACVASRNGFRTMLDLNPQVGRAMRILATSPCLISSVTGFRGDFTHPAKAALIDGLENLHNHVNGRQILMFFRSDGLIKIDRSALQTTERLLDRYLQLQQQPKVAKR